MQNETWPRDGQRANGEGEQLGLLGAAAGCQIQGVGCQIQGKGGVRYRGGYMARASGSGFSVQLGGGGGRVPDTWVGGQMGRGVRGEGQGLSVEGVG